MRRYNDIYGQTKRKEAHCILTCEDRLKSVENAMEPTIAEDDFRRKDIFLNDLNILKIERILDTGK